MVLALVVLISGCNPNLITGNDPAVIGVKQIANETLPLEVAKLSTIDLTSVDTFEKYQLFADSLNDLITILNKQNNMFNIEQINPTRESWEKASKLITEYGPLIKNYNQVILSAKAFEKDQNQNSLHAFYLNSGTFAFETGLIMGAVFYKTSYEVVGAVYRSLGFSSFALKCPGCVSVILSQAHWTIRTVFVEGSSQLAETATSLIEKGDVYVKTIK